MCAVVSGVDCPKAHDRYGKRKRFIMAKGKARFLTCKAYGKLKTLDYNPRTIDDVAFTKLCESIERDPEFMVVNKIKIDETNTVLGGNQRVRALLEIGYKEIPDEWVQMCLMPDGTPWTEEKKKRFILIDNSPAGMSGEFDYQIMEANFDRKILEQCGIDFSLLSESMIDTEITSAEDEAEKGEMGERDPELQNFIDAREKSRGKVGSMTDAGFYGCLVFKCSKQREVWAKWLDEHGIEMRFGGLFADGEAVAKLIGVDMPPMENVHPHMKPLETLAELAMTVEGEIPDEDTEVDISAVKGMEAAEAEANGYAEATGEEGSADGGEEASPEAEGEGQTEQAEAAEDVGDGEPVDSTQEAQGVF